MLEIQYDFGSFVFKGAYTRGQKAFLSALIGPFQYSFPGNHKKISALEFT